MTDRSGDGRPVDSSTDPERAGDGRSGPTADAGSDRHSNDSETQPSGSDGRTKGPDTRTSGSDTVSLGRRVAGILADYLFDLVVLTGWTIGLALLFLSTGWPRWGFYAALLIGALAFTQLSVRAGPGRSVAGDRGDT